MKVSLTFAMFLRDSPNGLMRLYTARDCPTGNGQNNVGPECTYEWMNEWMNEWMSEWMNEWMSDWMNELIN